MAFALRLAASSILLLSACSDTALSPAGYAAWVEDERNGLKVSQEAGDFVFTLQYKPADYVALLEKKKESGERSVESEMRSAGEPEERQTLQHFTLKIASKNGTEMLKTGIASAQEYYDRIQYFSFYMQHDLRLVDGGDTLDCVLHHFERNYGIAPYSNIVLAFEQSGRPGATDKKLIYNDRALGAGTVELVIRKEAVEGVAGMGVSGK